MIEALGLPGFFILHRDLLELARDVAVEVRGPDTARALLPPGRGRGSSVSSIVCYLTGLSHIDPVQNQLFLGRFLNEELTSLPDIDLDFPRDIREVLIPRIHERYGAERSALVAAFPTFRSRGAIRELGKVLGLPPGELERAARGAEPWAVRGVTGDVESALGLEPGGPPAAVYDPDPRMAAPFAMSTAEWQAMVNGRDPAKEGDRQATAEARYAALPGRWEWLARLCDEAYGLPRHLSQHSGGMIVSTRPLVDCCPVLPAAMEGRQLCQWDKDSCADAGFLKIDLLGLGMLSAVERCVESIARTRGERVDLSRIPFDDADTYTAIQAADTMGVFQIESRAQMQSLRRTRPETLDDLTIQVAIVRPGPILGGAVNPYIARLQALRADPDYVVPYDHPSLEPVLRDTLGTIIFQDQVIECAMAFAGFSPGEAEGLRRAMSRKRSAAAIEGYHQRFVEGAARTHGVDAETAERVYSMIVGFSGFGFPKAHGAAFGLLAYQSTWLRVHYGPEFLCALLNEQPMGFYASDTLAHEAQRRGIPMLPADVNESAAECAVAADGSVRIGLGYVAGVRADEVEALVAAREEGGRFRSLADLASRAGAGRPSLEKLAWAGACDALAGVDGSGASANRARRAALWQLGVAAPGDARARGHAARAAARHPGAARAARAGAVGVDGGRLRHDRADARRAPAGAAARAAARRRGHLPRPGEDAPRGAGAIGGLVVARQRPGTAKGIVFLLLEDEFGTINLIVPPDVYERHRLTVRTEPLMLARGRLEKLAMAGGAINVFVKRLEPLVTPDEDVAGVVELAERRAAAAAVEAPADRARRGRTRARSWPTSAASRRRCRASRPDGGGRRCSRAPREQVICRAHDHARLRPDLGVPRARPAPDRPQRRPERRAPAAAVAVPRRPQGGDRPVRDRAAGARRRRAVRGHRLRRQPRRHPRGQREQPHGGRAARPRAVRRTLHPVPHAGGLQLGRAGGAEPGHAAPAEGARARRDQERPRPRQRPDGGRPLQGEDAEDVAAYVAKAVGQTGQGQ